MYKREWAVTTGKQWSKGQSGRGRGSSEWSLTGDMKTERWREEARSWTLVFFQSNALGHLKCSTGAKLRE